MPLFFYSARNKRGTIVHGTIDAISAQSARESLRQMQLDAEELHEATLDEQKEISSITIAQEENVDPVSLPKGSESNPVQQKTPPKKVARKTRITYHPFIETLRLYAGWLLAWYILVYALGGYSISRSLLVDIPYVQALLPPFSPIVLRCTLFAFLFLGLTSLYKTIQPNRSKLASLWIGGSIAYFYYAINI